ncbi:MAG: sigma-54 interaction domain-containing protein [Candidatus Nitrosoglobus sp.]
MSLRQLLLDLWQEVGRHGELEETIERIAVRLQSALPLGAILVRRIDQEQNRIETVASVAIQGRTVPKQSSSRCEIGTIEAILKWGQRFELIRQAAKYFLPGLLPSEVDSEVLAGALRSEDNLLGVLLLIAAPAQHFTAKHQRLLLSLLEPFAVAVENDQRLQEMMKLREALEVENRNLVSRLSQDQGPDSIIGVGTGLRLVMERVSLVAPSEVPVLILGETGSGKEAIARAIHTHSRRSSGSFLRVNCGALPGELIDSELFGHERGSFTGATGQRRGWFERADKGTLFLDEIGELPLEAQVRLLRILQDGTFQRVGGEREMKVDVRVIAATHRDLQRMVIENRFREDLWYRIAVFPIYLPPLRERIEDIPALATHFALRAANRCGLAPRLPTSRDNTLLMDYPWPGNVRELASVMERATILGNGRLLEVEKALGVGLSLAPQVANLAVPQQVTKAESTGFESLTVVMKRHIEAALKCTRGCVEGPSGAAQLLAINPHTLRARMRKLGIDWRQFR